MQFKSYSIGLLFRLLAAAMPIIASGQLTWSNDVVVFGTEDDERQPRVVSIGEGAFRAYCVRNDSLLSMRKSFQFGNLWEQFENLPLGIGLKLWCAAADTTRSYALTSSPLSVTYTPHSYSAWPPAPTINVQPDSGALLAAHLFTDVDFQPGDSYLHLFVLVRSADNTATLLYRKSTDHGETFDAYREVATGLDVEDSSAHVCGAATWSGEDERIWAATTLDRPGTIGEQISLFYSDDFGDSWSAAVTPDSSSYAQYDPSISGRGELLAMAYSRRNSTSLAREVFYTYSPDNGVAWLEPLQVTSHAFDDLSPQIIVTNTSVGLLFARAPVLQALGTLYYRFADAAEPWNWLENERDISATDGVMLDDGFAIAPDRGYCAATWTGHIVGDDGDVFFDGQWRGLSVREQQEDRPLPNFRQFGNRIEIEIPDRRTGEVRLVNLLGREVARVNVSTGRQIWQLPIGLPSGNYWIAAEHALPVRVTIMR